MSSLRNGGAERSLVNLLQMLDYDRYDVDLVLFQEEGMFLKQLPKNVNLRHDCEELHVLFEKNVKKIIRSKHFNLSIKHVVTTVISKKKCGKGPQSAQYRWEHFYKKLIPQLSGHYDVAIAYLHREPTYFLVDKVNADKKIAWVHNDYSKIMQSRAMDQKYFSMIDKIVTISDLCVDALVQDFPMLKEKFVMLPNLTSSDVVKSMADEFYPSEYEKDGLCFVSIGRLNIQKGFDLAVKAAAILKKHGLHFRWYILGIGELKGELEKMIQQECVSDCFFLIGAKENPYPYMKNADVVVQTSRFEGKSVVLDEAKILGCPIVVTNYPTVYDQISSDEGIITELTPEGIASGVEEMLSKKAKFSEFLLSNDYGNQHEIQGYYKLIEE